MTKRELLLAWQAEVGKGIPGGVSMARLELLLDCLGVVIAQEMRTGVETPLPHVGKLKVRDVAARTGHNPWTGAQVTVPAKRRVSIKLCKNLREQLRK